MHEDYIITLFRFLTDLSIQQADVFEAMAIKMWHAFSLFSLVVFFFGASLPGRGWDWHKLVKLLAIIVVSRALILFYIVPFPGLGTSFTAFILDWGQTLANELNKRMYDTVVAKLDILYLTISVPSIYSILAPILLMGWLVIILSLLAAKLAVTISITFGYIGVGVCLLVGPVFICFLPLPGFAGYFWNWLKATLQFAFYGVVANAVVFILGSVMINFIDSNLGNDWSGVHILSLLPALTLYLGVFTLGVTFMPPILTSVIFSGHTGQAKIDLVK